MLAISPLFPTSDGWSLDDFISQHYCDSLSIEIESKSDSPSADPQTESHSLHCFPSFDHRRHQYTHENPKFFTKAVNRGTSDPEVMAKKLNHNASERDRRKRINSLYSFLRSLLPSTRDQMKKLSIPRTVSGAVKYITELQKEVEALIHKKEQLLFSKLSSSTGKEGIGLKEQCGKDPRCGSLVVTSVSVVSEGEVVIQLITSTADMKKNKKTCLLSEAIQYLEKEEDRLILLSATTIKCFGEERLLNTLIFKVQGNQKIDAETLKEKLCSI